MSKKDAYWFRHDSNAHRDIKIKKLIHLHGWAGYGLFWAVVEVLREQEDYKWECDEPSLQMLCDVVGCKDEAKFLSWYRDCLNLMLFFEIDGAFTSRSLCERMELWEVKKNNGLRGGRPKTVTVQKPKQNLNDKLNDKLSETIIEEKRIEENSREKNAHENSADLDTETETSLIAFATSRSEQTETLCKNHDLQPRQLKSAAQELVSHYRAKGDGFLPKGTPYHVLNNWLLKGKQFTRNGNGKPETDRQYEPADLAKGGKYYHPIIKVGHPDFEAMRKSIDRLKPVQ